GAGAKEAAVDVVELLDRELVKSLDLHGLRSSPRSLAAGTRPAGKPRPARLGAALGEASYTRSAHLRARLREHHDPLLRERHNPLRLQP
ncbi:MAG: hypothetical protein ACM3UV_03195, partial [Nocardioidaceae bacterium]